MEAPEPQGAQPSQYLPSGPPDPLMFEGFEGINTMTLRPGVDDKEAAWLSNFMPLGPKRNLRTMWGLSAPLSTVAELGYPSATISFFEFVNIGTNPYCFLVLSNGALYVINTNTGVPKLIANPGTIFNPSQTTVGISQYGSSFVIIVSQQTNGYFIWDGTKFYFPGDVGPDGKTMPVGLGGTAVEIYTGRVWIAGGASIIFSAPGSITDFSSANGGGNFTSTDSFLRYSFVQLKQTNGFLYLIGDSSINYISGVQTSGSPTPITTFTNQNADPEVGTAWPGTVDVFSRNILFANPFGAQVSYGGAVTKISEKLDGVYNTTGPNFANLVPSAAKATIFGKKCWILLLPIIDPIINQQVNKLFLWNGKIWWAAEQEVSLTFIQYQEISSVLTAWGTDGKSIYQLFAQPSPSLTKTAQSKLWDAPGGYQFAKFVTRLWGIVKYYDSRNPSISVTIDDESGTNVSPGQISAVVGFSTWFNADGTLATWTTDLGVTSEWVGGGAYSLFAPQAVGQNGVLIGMTVQTQCADMALISVMMDAKIGPYRG